MKNPVFDLSEAAARQTWYVIHSKPHKENQIEVYLKTRGIETFCPMLAVEPVNPRAARRRPYFPGYVFARVNLDAIGLNTLQWMPGAVGVVQFDGQAAVVSDAIISQLRRRLCGAQGCEGQADAQRTRSSPADSLKPGDPVRIIDGPLTGYDALFDLRLNGSQRVQVLLEMLGSLVRVEVNAYGLEKIKQIEDYPWSASHPHRMESPRSKRV